jgi:hypothetical protein
MCGSKNKSFVWQEKIIDFITAKFNIDGFHLEAFNGGRCKCSLCNKVNNIEYFSKLNTVVAKYIRNTYRDKMVFVNNCGCLPWGDYVATKDFKHLYELCNHIDVFLDNGCHGLFIREENRVDFIRGLNCDFGTSGGIWFCPPSKRNRLTWFLPYADKVYKYLKKISNDGARACYYYMGPIINPSTKFNIYFGGLAMSNISLEFNKILSEVIDKLYGPKNTSACKNLMEIFVRAENAYFGNWNPSMNIFSIKKEFLGGLFEFYEWSKENYHRIKSGELFLEPLVNNKVELPLYLLINMNKTGRMKYRKKLDEILKDLAKIGNNFKDNRKIDIIRICIENVIKELDRYIDFQVYN